MQNSNGNAEKASKQDKEALKNFSRIADDVEKLIKELESKLSTLPTVDEEATSECPFAEDLYAKMEEAAENLSQAIELLQLFIPLLDREVARCQKNLDHIRSGAGRLVTPEAKRLFQAAHRLQMQEYLKAVENCKTAEFLLERAALVLKRAKSKKFPGGKPQRQGPFVPTSSGPPYENARKPKLGKELDGIFSVRSAR